MIFTLILNIDVLRGFYAGKEASKRLNVLLGIVIAIFVVLTISLSALQIVKGDEYEKLAEKTGSE